MRHSPLPAIPYLSGFLLLPLVMVCVTERGFWTYVPVPVQLGLLAWVLTRVHHTEPERA